jgi:hypothetical protein
LDITERYTTSSGRTFLIKLTYNEKIRERDTADAFVQNIDISDSETHAPISVPVKSSRFSTFENFTSFGSYCAINYQGTRGAAIEGLRTKILTRIEDALERVGEAVA